jgi:dipeptidyl aminopeptidase/acylaminoacyl peptidase
MVCHGLADGESAVIRACIGVLLAGASACCSLAGTDPPPPEFFRVLKQPLTSGPRITPYLRYQAEQAWKEDEARQKAWDAIRDEGGLRKLQDDLRQKLLQMIGGLPTVKTELHAEITGRIPMDGFTIEKLVFQSLPGIYVTALVYVPNDHVSKHPAVLVPAGHAADGKFHYQALSQRLAGRGYIVIAWDPVGQGERSQFWDSKQQRSRYNLICAEHAVMGNLAYLAGANLARWEVWDGIRAVDYLLTRPDVDGERISITGTSGGGTQTALIAALDPRIKVAVPSCYITALPMRMANRIFVDPDSDPEQDLFGMISNGVDHPGLLLLIYPRPVMVAAAVLDFFPIEGTRKTFRELQGLYMRFGHGDRIAIVEGYHGHQYSTENQQAALDFIDHFNRMAVRTNLPVVKELDGQTLQCTRTGQVLVDYSDGRPLTDVIREYYEEHKSGSALTLAQEYYGEKYGGVKNWRVTQNASVLPQAGVMTWASAGSSQVEGAAIDRYLLRHSGSLEMPLLYIHKSELKSGSGERKAALWFSENGKATSEDWPEIEKYLTQGFDIISLDFRGLGETRMPYTAVSPDDPLLGKLDFDHAYVYSISGVLANYVYNSFLTGRPYFLQMMEDAEIAKRFAAEKLHVNVVAATATGDGYTLAGAIAETLPGMSLLPEPNGKVLKWSEIVEQKRESWPIQYLLPGGAYIH